MHQLGTPKNPRELEALIQEADTDKSGDVDFAEFVNAHSELEEIPATHRARDQTTVPHRLMENLPEGYATMCGVLGCIDNVCTSTAARRMTSKTIFGQNDSVRIFFCQNLFSLCFSHYS